MPPSRRYRFALSLMLGFLVLPAAVLAQVADPGASSASVAPGVVSTSYAGMPPILRQTLAEQGHTITVLILDTGGIPLAGVDASRIQLGTLTGTGLTFCAPLFADGPTGADGLTTISGHIDAGGWTDEPAVLLDGVVLGSGALPLSLASPDAFEGNVDIVDAHQQIMALQLEDYWYMMDLNRNGVNDIPDYSLQALAMGHHCSWAPDPALQTAEGSIGLYFDRAGTITYRDLEPGDGSVIPLYLIAKGLSRSLAAMEFAIPAFADPDIIPLTPDWSAPPYEFANDGNSWYQVVFGSLLPPPPEIVLVSFSVIVNRPMVNMEFTVEAIPDPFCSFRSPNRPGWTHINGLGHRMPFASTTSSVLNPLGHVFDGIDHRPDGVGEIIDLEDRLRFELPEPGPGGMGMGMGAGSDGSFFEFLTTMPADGLPMSAFFRWDYAAADSTPFVSLTGVRGTGGFDMTMDMQNLGAPTMTLELRSGQDLVAQRPGYGGTWTASSGLPTKQWIIRTDGDLLFSPEWDTPVWITLDDNTQHLIDDLQIRPETNLPVPERFIRNVRLTAEDIPPIEIGREALVRFDAGYFGAQNLVFASEDRQLHLLLQDPALPGQVTLGSANDQPVQVRGHPLPWPPVAPVEMICDFRTDDGSGRPGLPFTLTEQGGVMSMNLGLAEQGAKDCVVISLLGGQIVSQATVTSEYLGTCAAWPASLGMEGTEVVLRWAQPTDLDLVDPAAKAAVQADELRLAPVAPVDLPDGTGVDVTITGTDRLVMTGELAASSTPVVRDRGLELHPNYPNPFNPSTNLGFTIPAAGKVRLGIYDLRGRLVANLLDEWREAGEGSVTWHGKDQGGRGVASGVYYAVLRTGGETRSRKLSLLK